MSDEHSNNQSLTEHMILLKTRANALSDVKALNMWGYNLVDVCIIEKMPNLEIAAFPVNNIVSLKPFASCYKIRELFLRHNQISNFQEIAYLKNIRCLRNLSLSENPICQLPNYREKIISMLPQLCKLDDVEVSEPMAKNQEIPTARREPKTKYEPKKEIPKKINQNHGNYYDDEMSCESAKNKVSIKYQDAKRNRLSGKHDEGALTAILALLPELSPESLGIVLQSISELGH